MDDIVKQAMAKWPNVPACSGWLGLDARGQWHLRDDVAQACGSFASGNPGAKGALVRHEKLAEFIGRNYLAESDGRWFFQNGPQRVYVELECTPWVWRLRWDGTSLALHSHVGVSLDARTVHAAMVDEEGRLYLALSQGLGLVHTQDMLDAASALEAGLLPACEEVLSDTLPKHYGFIRSPQMHKAG
ncbi:Protein of uncharacterised function (DUF2946) [Delftia tsuruhatensis]|uniref:DUF2946 family protein n=1 Tax=Delftia tsuruhatensis TaxID=180282 RepID=UPI001E6B9FEE|nr:DUF2946 family protein [Delftia tsuruhatensis]CAB5723925.1 Protein of uncharacterised function (DUF2946) [Delftia tsuruhatensis]CAC9676296.1 Protein of uncharacterised function (DUF2946) [Delftia tsuruhatensis]